MQPLNPRLPYPPLFSMGNQDLEHLRRRVKIGAQCARHPFRSMVISQHARSNLQVRTSIWKREGAVLESRDDQKKRTSQSTLGTREAPYKSRGPSLPSLAYWFWPWLSVLE